MKISSSKLRKIIDLEIRGLVSEAERRQCFLFRKTVSKGLGCVTDEEPRTVVLDKPGTYGELLLSTAEDFHVILEEVISERRLTFQMPISERTTKRSVAFRIYSGVQEDGLELSLEARTDRINDNGSVISVSWRAITSAPSLIECFIHDLSF